MIQLPTAAFFGRLGASLFHLGNQVDKKESLCFLHGTCPDSSTHLPRWYLLGSEKKKQNKKKRKRQPQQVPPALSASASQLLVWILFGSFLSGALEPNRWVRAGFPSTLALPLVPDHIHGARFKKQNATPGATCATSGYSGKRGEIGQEPKRKVGKGGVRLPKQPHNAICV